MLYAATLRCPHAHARVVKVDLAKAREMPGVRAVLSDADKEATSPGITVLDLRGQRPASAVCSIRIAATRAKKSP